jgi:acetoin utilization deacetylase AcuC-like enzyme
MKKDKKVAYITDEIYLEHDTGAMHPESPQRLRAINEAIVPLKNRLIFKAPIKVSENILSLVHSDEHIEMIRATSESGGNIDSDTICSIESYNAASMAVGAGVVAIDGIKAGEFERVFCAVRPPGHHATPTQAMGFCLFNNVALGAHYAIKKKGLSRVLIVDWDLHHGNGTQHAFYSDARVLYISTHQYPYYPGTGSLQEIGEGEGEGYTVNIPLSTGNGDEEYANLFRHIILPIGRAYKPELILVSAGFDIHKGDPLGGMNVTEEGFARLAYLLLELAKEVCEGRIVFTLEGGYNVEGEARAVVKILHTLQGELPFDPEAREKAEDAALKRIAPTLERVKAIYKPYWKELA